MSRNDFDTSIVLDESLQFIENPRDASNSFAHGLGTGVAENQFAPEDHFNFVYIVFVMFGVAVLQPWNAVLSLLQFFAHSSVHNPEFAFPIAMHVFIIVGMLYVMWKGPNNGS